MSWHAKVVSDRLLQLGQADASAAVADADPDHLRRMADALDDLAGLSDRIRHDAFARLADDVRELAKEREGSP